MQWLHWPCKRLVDREGRHEQRNIYRQRAKFALATPTHAALVNRLLKAAPPRKRRVCCAVISLAIYPVKRHAHLLSGTPGTACRLRFSTVSALLNFLREMID